MRIGIIGAGASGMMAAVTAADYGAEVIIFEKNDRVGKKILATGNGKCNLSNLDFTMDKYYCEDKDKLKDMFSLFSNQDTLSFFERNGMMIRSKNGYLYPYSEQASTVLDIFRRLLEEKKITVITETDIADVCFHNRKKCFILQSRGQSCEFDRLILACGGPASLKKGSLAGFQLAGKFGHTVKALVPALVQLRASDSFLKSMAGVRTQADLRLYADGKLLSQEQGELQLTEYGISGIPVFQFSREAGYALKAGKKVTVEINFFPDYEGKIYTEMIKNRFKYMKNVSVEDFLLGLTNKKINTALLKYAGIKPQMQVNSLGLQKITELMETYRKLTVHIIDTNGMENAQVCAGGVDLKEVDDKLQSLKQTGLFLAGEMLDVDGKCGGYNLQWAWTSGYIAGRNAAGGF
ncbi:MAG: NAD(P)/FAD-dependent oxidoreductase [Suilimivivens sp.]